MEKKFELTAECKIVLGVKLFRIRALKAIAKFSVKIGDLGGWIEKEGNLSQDGDAWVCDDAQVYGNARVYGNAWMCGNARVYGDAWVCDDAQVYGNAWVYDSARVYDNAVVRGYAEVYGYARVCGNAEVYGNAVVRGNADYMVFKNTWSSYRWFTYTCSNKMWAVGCFRGTGEELIKKAYADSETSGKCYEAIVRAAEAIEAAKGEAKGGTK